MANAHFLRLTHAQVRDGSWLEIARSAWLRGEIGLVLVEPEPSADAELRAAVATMIASNGSYEAGDRAVIHARPAALDMGCETATQLIARGVETTVVFGMASLGHEVGRLIQAAQAAARRAGKGPGAQAAGAGDEASVAASHEAKAGGSDEAKASASLDLSHADPAIIEGVADCYRQLLAPFEANGRGHWIVPIGTAPDPDPAHVPAIDFFMKVAGRGLAGIGPMRNDGRIRSHDIWLAPSMLDVDRLNEGLPAEKRWTLEEWRSLIFRSMAVSADELRRLALAIEGVELTIHASRKGGTLHYQREDGTDFRYKVKDRPVILDCGAVGVNSLGGTTAYRSAITNQPTTEVFVAPLEDSLQGVIVYTQPQRAAHGVIRAPYRIEVRAGRVIGVEAPDEESVRILRNYTGLEPYDRKPLAGDEAEAFRLRGVIAEMAIAGFNPAMMPEVRSGRLRPVTGLVLTDEKVGDHQAFGSNDQFMGATPSAYGGEHVEHTDFVGSIERMMKLE
ncbi:MAG: aminopeptidase [Candidatus Eisenbacteria bacterium]|nr:aminopeptidase [Candidatus Eisenbacteria bacterium]